MPLGDVVESPNQGSNRFLGKGPSQIAAQQKFQKQQCSERLEHKVPTLQHEVAGLSNQLYQRHVARL